MHTITERDLIRDVAKRWASVYASGSYGPDKMEKLEALQRLNAETATADDCEEIIGNRSWTRLKCDECGHEVSAVVEVGEEPEYESSTAQVCFTCIAKAADLAHNA